MNLQSFKLQTTEDINNGIEDYRGTVKALTILGFFIVAVLTFSGLSYHNNGSFADMNALKLLAQVCICLVFSTTVTAAFLVSAIYIAERNGVDTRWCDVTPVQKEEIERALESFPAHSELAIEIKGLDRELVQLEYRQIMKLAKK